MNQPIGPPAQAGDTSAGQPIDALEAVGEAILQGAKPPSTGDPHVNQAFVLGWQMNELSQPGRRRSAAPGDLLAGLGSLDDRQRAEILVDQIQAAIYKLGKPISDAGLNPVSVDALRSNLDPGTAAFRTSVISFHRRLLGLLTATDFRLGKAYGLGNALAGACYTPAYWAAVTAAFDRQAVASLSGWLDDLSSSLPPHAGHSVATSIQRWSDYISSLGSPPDPAATLQVLQRQGELWRALLSGEKHGTETLEVGNYLDATHELASHLHQIGKATLRRLWVVVLTILILIGISVWTLATGSGSSNLVAGAGGLLAAVGLTWKGLGTAIGRLAAKVEPPLWGAVLDSAITDAITLVPHNPGDVRGRRASAMQMAPPRAAAPTTAAPV